MIDSLVVIAGCWVTSEVQGARCVWRRPVCRVTEPPRIDSFSFPRRKLYDRVSVSCVVSSGDLPIDIAWSKDDAGIPHQLGVVVQVCQIHRSILHYRIWIYTVSRKKLRMFNLLELDEETWTDIRNFDSLYRLLCSRDKLHLKCSPIMCICMSFLYFSFYFSFTSAFLRINVLL